MKLRTRNILAGVVGVLGLTQMLGGVAGSRTLKGIGAAIVIAPYPKVFSDVDGLETFASEFTIFTREGEGVWTPSGVTPEVYSKVRGSYNRRNVYGAAISYGPKMPEGMRRAVFRYALEEPGLLAAELGLPGGRKVVVVRTKTKGRNDRWALASDLETELLFRKENGGEFGYESN